MFIRLLLIANFLFLGCLTTTLVAGEFDRSLPQFARLSPDELQLLDDFCVATRQLLRQYEDCQLAATTLVERSEGSELKPHGKVHQTYASRQGGSLRLEEEIAASQRPSSVNLAIVRPDEQYLLGKDADTRKYFLRGHTKDFSQSQLEFRVRSAHAVPCKFLDSAMLDAMLLTRHHLRAGLDYSIDQVELVTNELGEDIAVIACSSANPETGSRSTTRIQLLPRQLWAVSEIVHDGFTGKPELKLSHPFVRNVVRCRYQIGSNPPELKSYVNERWGRNAKGEFVIEWRATTTVTSLNFESASLDLFDPGRLLPD